MMTRARKPAPKSETSFEPKRSQFAPRPFASPVEEHEPPSIQSLERAARFGHSFGHSFGDIDIFPQETVQPKLALGPVGDRYEQEADQVAQRVVETISSPEQESIQRQEDLEDEEELDLEEDEELRRKVAGIGPVGGADVGPGLESAIHWARSRGKPLSDRVRQPMERAFGADFGGVRVHADDQADRLNRSLQARAFTTGQDIFLRQGEYRPGNSEGQRLLAHELTHVVQQSTGLAAGIRGGMTILPASSSERRQNTKLMTMAVSNPTVIQRWIKLANITEDDPSRYGLSEYSPNLRFGYEYFNMPDVERGRPKEGQFHQLTDFWDTFYKVRDALKFLFGTDVRLGPVSPILMEWMGYVRPRNRNEELKQYIVGDVLKADLPVKEQYKIREDAGVQAEMRYYHTYGELAWALAQEMATKGWGPLSSTEDRSDKVAENVLQENMVAIQVLESAWVKNKLKSIAKKCNYELLGLLQENDKGKKTAYAELHRRKSINDVFSGLIQEEDPANLIALLHDVKDFWLSLHERRRDVAEEPFDWQTSNKKNATTIRIGKFDMRYNVGTPDEADPWVMFMRERRRPVWAGPSMTMRAMWLMAKDVYADADEMTAIGYALFAYWSIIYPQTATPIHRFHGTMAAARRYGVTYDPEKTVEENARDCIPDFF
jgi:hypothetical protein